MYGRTNGSCSSSSVETININFTSNQTDHSDLIGATATVEYGEISVTYTWDGTISVNIKIPTYAVYTITFSDVKGYKTPDSISGTAELGTKAMSVVYQTEIVTVNVTADEGSISGYSINVYNGTQTVATKTYKIPFGTSYTVSASEIDGYTTPQAQTFTADSVSRTVTVQYLIITTPSSGVWIQSTDGKYYSSSEWSSSGKTANGVAVFTDECSFIIALQDAHSGYCEWGPYGTTINNILTTTSYTKAKTDYLGESNTEQIMNQSSYCPAATYCNSFTFPNGQTGYLPALGELYVACQNKSAIETANAVAGGAAFCFSYWSSTQADANDVWYMDWIDENVYLSTKDGSLNIRAFAAV